MSPRQAAQLWRHTSTGREALASLPSGTQAVGVAVPCLISLKAEQVHGLQNQAADLWGLILGDRRLQTDVMAEVADLLASRESTYCSLFFSLRRDNPPLGRDAFAHQWP